VAAVRFSISAWHTYRSLPDDDAAKVEIEHIVFNLVERGLSLPGVHATEWPWGTGVTPGFSVELGTSGGFVACAPLVDPGSGEAFIGVIHIVIQG
jgi:hypothetical protein